MVQILWDELCRFDDTIHKAQTVLDDSLPDLGCLDTSKTPHVSRFSIVHFMFSQSRFCWARISAKSGSKRRRCVFRWVQYLLQCIRMCLDPPNPTPADAWRHLRPLWDRNQWSWLHRHKIYSRLSLKSVAAQNHWYGLLMPCRDIKTNQGTH